MTAVCQQACDNVSTMKPFSNLFAEVPAKLPDELTQAILSTPGLRIERIVSYGHASPDNFWYDQDKNEWVLLVQGAARLLFEGEESVKMIAGSFIDIPAHKRHRVEMTDSGKPTIWLAVHYS